MHRPHRGGGLQAKASLRRWDGVQGISSRGHPCGHPEVGATLPSRGAAARAAEEVLEGENELQSLATRALDYTLDEEVLAELNVPEEVSADLNVAEEASVELIVT